jgi:hypothetical protein
VYSRSDWFKSWKESVYSNGENNTNSHRNFNTNHNTNTRLCLSDFFWNYAELYKFCNHIFSFHRNRNGSLLFFISRHFTNKEKRQNSIRDHHRILKEDVLKHWFNQSIEVSRERHGFHESLIPLYVSVIENLKTPIHLRELKSHLMHHDNKELNKIFEDLERREPVQNKKVSEYTDSIERKIKNAIDSKDNMLIGGCKIENIIQYDSGHEPRIPNYIMRHVVLYYIDKAQTDGLDLDLRPLDERIFQVHFDLTEIGRGDEESMKCLLRKLKALEPDLVDDLRALINERNSLIELFDVEFKQKIKAMMAQADYGRLSGECSWERDYGRF